MAAEFKSFRRDAQNKSNPPKSEQILDRSPPFDIAAEMGVLGSMLLHPDVTDDLTLILRDDDFYEDAHRKLYHHMKEMYESGKKIDAMLLVNELKSSGDFELIGGAA